MSKTTRIAACPFADTYENLSKDNPILRNGQRVYVTDKKQWYTGDGQTPFNNLQPESLGGDLSGYQTIENLSDNYSAPEFFKENGYLSQSGAFNLYTEIMAERLSPISADIEELNKKVKTFEELPNLLDAINTSVFWALDRLETDGANRYYNTILDFLNETQVDNPDGPGPDIYTEPAFATMMLPKGSIITIATKSIPNLQVLEINSDGFTSDLANIEQTEENLASQINDLLNTNGCFYTKWIKFGKFCDESSGSSEIPQEELDRLNYYGNKNIVPTDVSYFTVDSSGAISYNGEDTIQEIVIPYNIGTKIARRAFLNYSLRKVILPYGIETIEPYAFQNCMFNEINLPDSLTSIKGMAFAGNSELRDIIIPLNVSEIQQSAFSGCNHLRKVVILNDNITIGNNAFDTDNESLIIICNPGSKAEDYAKTNGIKCAYDYVDINSLGGSSVDLSEYQKISSIVKDTSVYYLSRDELENQYSDDNYVHISTLRDTIDDAKVELDKVATAKLDKHITEESGFIVTNEDNENENSNNAIIIGYDGCASGVDGIAIGHYNQAEAGITIGSNSSSFGDGIAIGNGCNGFETGVGIGNGVITNGVAIGNDAVTASKDVDTDGTEMPGDAINAIQLGQGWNTEEGTFQVYDYQLLNAEGKIPTERLPEGISSGSDSLGNSTIELDAIHLENLITGYGDLCNVNKEVLESINFSSLNLTEGTYKLPVTYVCFGIDYSTDLIVSVSKCEVISYFWDDDNNKIPQTEDLYYYNVQIKGYWYTSSNGSDFYPMSTKIIDSLEIDDNESIYALSQNQGIVLNNKINELSDIINETLSGDTSYLDEGRMKNDIYDSDLADEELCMNVIPSVKFLKDYISNMFYLDGDNLKISIGGKTFTLTPDAE